MIIMMKLAFHTVSTLSNIQSLIFVKESDVSESGSRKVIFFGLLFSLM